MESVGIPLGRHVQPNRLEFYCSGGVARVMHWPATLLLFVVLSLAWVATSLSPEAANKGTRFVLHKSVGLRILDIAVCRIIRRKFHETPPHPPIPVIFRGAGHDELISRPIRS